MGNTKKGDIMKSQSCTRSILSLISVLLIIFSAGLWCADAQDAGAATCPANMTSYWLLDETAGATFLDSVGGHDAVCTVCPDFTTGRVGNALLFNGVDDGLKVPADASFNWGLADSFTIEFWTKTDSTNTCAGNQVIIGRDDSSTDLHWWIGCWHYSGVAAFRLRDTNGNGILLFGSTPLNDGQWHHIAAVRNNASAENSLFVDGRREDSVGFSYTTGFGSATFPINIGWLNLTPFYHFKGTIDEVALYDRALTETEIQQHYLDGAANTGYCTDDPPAAPQIISPAVTTAYAGWPYVYNVDATGNPAPTYSLSGEPAGMTIDAGSGIIQWIPGSTDTLTVSADNSEGTDGQTFTITVLNPSLCPSDITHYWKLDEDAAGSYRDVRRANNAVCSDCPAAVPGLIENAQQFDAISRVNVKDDNTFDWRPNDSFSIELWMMTDPASTCAGTEVFMGRDDRGTSLHWWLGCSPAGGYARFYLVDKGGTDSGVSGTTDLTDGSWHHIVATRDADSDTINLYVDGALEGTQSAAYPAGFDSRTSPVNIGWLNVSPYYHFVGTLDDVAVYDRVLSDTEIYQHSLAGASGKGYCDTVTPVINPIPDQTGNEIVPFSYTVTAYGNPAPTFSLTTSPAGMTINATTGVISWTPAGGQAGANDVTVRAANSAGADTESFVINVTALPAYSLNITAVNGSVTKNPDQTMYTQGTTVTLTAVPNPGYTFTGWSGDATGAANPIQITMNGNKNITANFAAIDYWSMITPAASGKVQSGQDYTIQWTAPPQAVSFKVLYSLDNGTTWTLIKKNHTALTYTWFVPLQIKNKTKCRIKVVGFTGTGVSAGKIMSGLFTIEGPVKVLMPNGDGDLLTSGSPYLIEWQTLASVGSSVTKVILNYTTDGGTTWKTITSLPELPGDPANPGSYNWYVPDVPKKKGNCKVMVILKGAAGTLGKDMSDAIFSIQP